MTQYKRITGKVFGGNATATGNDPQIAQFGSALAGTFIGTTDPQTIQQLPAWGEGWSGAVTPETQFPPMPEMTGAMKVLSHQICGILQQGVSTWDSGTIYYTGNFCSKNGAVYVSLTDENQGNDPVSDTANWRSYGGANLDLSNLSATGEKHFLNKSQITNCLLEVPQRINLELTDSGLTLKAGSVVIIPNGTDGFKEVVISADLTMALTAFTGSEQFMLFYNATKTGAIAGRRLASQVASGTMTPTTGHWDYYNTTDNYVYVVINGEIRDYKASFPLGLITVTNGTITSIDQVFNGFGFIGNVMFAHKGIKGLIPNGRNADGTLNNIEFVTSEVLVHNDTTGHDRQNQDLVLTAATLGIRSLSSYLENENYNYNGVAKAIEKNCVVGKFSKTPTQVTMLKPKLPFRAVDYNDFEKLNQNALLDSDKAEISGWSMPSTKYTNLTLAESGTEYTAPAHGWVYINKVCSGSGQYINIVNKASGLSTASVGISSNNTLGVYLPISEGTKFAVNYTAGGTTNAFRFIYAIGDK